MDWIQQFNMEWLADPNAWAALATLTAMEIVLGIDNIIFISILAGKLPPEHRDRARTLGLLLAMITRILLLLSISWIMQLTRPLATIAGRGLSGRDLILLAGGLFLMWKATREIHERVEGVEDEAGRAVGGSSFPMVLLQIMVLDIVFSLDSVITAVGMADHVPVMVLAVVISVGIMLFAAKPINEFVEEHPTVKMLALAFLLMVGITLVAEGWHFHVPKGYVYTAMCFSVAVETLNLRATRRRARGSGH